MLTIDYIRQNRDKVRKAIVDKNSIPVDLDLLISYDDKRKRLLTQVQALRERRNNLAKEKPSNERVMHGRKIKEELKAIEAELQIVETELEKMLYQVPNIPREDVPVGADESANVVIKEVGTPTKFDFTPKDHVELGKILDIIDIERAAKVSGTRFYYLKNELVLLEFALVQYVFRTLTDKVIIKEVADSVQEGYFDKVFTPIVPPVMIRPKVFRQAARLDDETEVERFRLERDDLYLIGSAEHTLCTMHADEILNEKDLPLRYIAFSTSFRREAGSYGKDTRGILRVHQFDKLEMESFTTAEDSLLEQHFLVALQEYMVQDLGIPYRVVNCCTGDMGAPDSRHIDIEMWMPGQQRYRESHSADLMDSYQAVRLHTKYRLKDGTTKYVHTNDATAFAISRTLIAILENYQQKDGSVVVPKALRPFVNFDRINPKS